MLQELRNFERIYHNFEWGLYWPRPVEIWYSHFGRCFRFTSCLFLPICSDHFWSYCSWQSDAVAAWLKSFIQLFGIATFTFHRLENCASGCWWVIFHWPVFLVGWVLLCSPNGVLDVLGVESDEEAEDGEEHDTVCRQHQATCSTINLEKSRVRKLKINRMEEILLHLINNQVQQK